MIKIESIKEACPKRLVALAALFAILVSLGMLVAGMVIAPSGHTQFGSGCFRRSLYFRLHPARGQQQKHVFTIRQP